MLLAAACAAPLPAVAQAVQVETGTVAQGWTFADGGAFGLARIDTRAVPFAVSVRPADIFALRVGGSWGFARLAGVGGETVETSRAPRDVDVRASFIPTRSVRVSFVSRIAVGDPEWSVADATLAGFASGGLLPVVPATWTGGTVVGGEVEVEAPAGASSLRFHAGYRQGQGSITLVGTDLDYRPGSRFDVGVSIRTPVSDAGALTVSGGVRRFGEDAAGPLGLFQAGLRFDAGATLAVPWGLDGSTLVYARVTRRAGGDATDPGTGLGPTLDAYRTLLPGLAGTPGSLVGVAGLRARWALGRTALIPHTEGRIVRGEGSCGAGEAREAAGCLADQGWLATAGLALEVRAAGPPGAPSLLLRPHASAGVGRAVPAGAPEARLTGWEAGLMLRISGGAR